MYISLSACVEYIQSDLYRYAGRVSMKIFIKHYWRNRSFRYSFWFRLLRVRSRPLRTVAKLMHNRLSIQYGIEMPAGVQIGYGLYIGHNRCVIINPSAQIGNNCNLSQFTTIGANHGKAAVIGDNVYIGPHVSIVEDVTVGDNATIGAGAVIVKDVPAGATVAGNPGRVVSYKTGGRYIGNKWPLDRPDERSPRRAPGHGN